MAVGCSPQFLLLIGLSASALLAGCGGTTGGPMADGGGFLSTGGATASGGDGNASGGDLSGVGGGAGGTDATGGSGGDGGSASGGESSGSGGVTYVEKECPDEEPPSPQLDCDPFATDDECGLGYGCYPYLEYPAGEGCGFPQFGAVCVPRSTGTQGDACGSANQTYCEPGFLCVVGAGAGARCKRLCSPSAPECPSGLLCTETDVKGYGVCF